MPSNLKKLAEEIESRMAGEFCECVPYCNSFIKHNEKIMFEALQKVRDETIEECADRLNKMHVPGGLYPREISAISNELLRAEALIRSLKSKESEEK